MARPSDYSEIYELVDPLTGHVKYIGKAKNAAERLAGHIRDCRQSKTPSAKWIRSLLNCRALPICRVVACVVGRWQDCERAVIAQYRAGRFNILNLADGGNAPFCSQRVRARNGRRNARAIHGDPIRRRMWELKKKAGDLMRCRFTPLAAKLRVVAAFEKNPEFWNGWVPKCPQ